MELLNRNIVVDLVVLFALYRAIKQLNCPMKLALLHTMSLLFLPRSGSIELYASTDNLIGLETLLLFVQGGLHELFRTAFSETIGNTYVKILTLSSNNSRDIKCAGDYESGVGRSRI